MNAFFGGIYKKPFKIFVTATGHQSSSTSSGRESTKHEIPISNSHKVYEEVLKSTPELKRKAQPPPQSTPKIRTEEALRPFEKIKFLKGCQENDLETLSKMDLSNPADLNVVDDYGWNGLMIAACGNAVDAFSYLLANGIDFEQCDKSGRNALQLAEKKGFNRILDAFREYVAHRRGESLRESTDEESERSGSKSFHCELCDMDFKETTRSSHETSVLHQFHGSQPTDAAYKLSYGIPAKNRGYQLMIKQGWKSRGLGPSETGRLYPIKTVLRKARSGLGTEQVQPERVTHFRPNDLDAVRHRPLEIAKGRRAIVRDYETNRQRERRLRRALT